MPVPPEAKPKKSSKTNMRFGLIDLVIAFAAGGFLVGVVLSGKDLIEKSRLNAQITQIHQFDVAIEEFHDKYEGIPGDLLSIQAERFNLPHGDGKPGRSDGDGKISPCSPGWQWNLGCESALFWAQLSAAGLISGNYTADSQLYESRLLHTGSLIPYLPQSSLGENIYIAVWNSDPVMQSPQPRLHYGNYFEITQIKGVSHEKFLDNVNALTPVQAQAIDQKIDDGAPQTGRIIANGEANWPIDSWGTLAAVNTHNCVSSDQTYNVNLISLAHKPLCHLAIAFTCCEKAPE